MLQYHILSIKPWEGGYSIEGEAYWRMELAHFFHSKWGGGA